jgi:hypothetical protein
MLQNNLIINVHSRDQCFGSGFTAQNPDPDPAIKLIPDPGVHTGTKVFEDKENVI